MLPRCFLSPIANTRVAGESQLSALWTVRLYDASVEGVTLDDIQSDARNGVKDARKALELLNDNRFKK
ncbi:hypothetical protein [Burkholderia sp. BCC0405]|uniref:hypothetical protein n=1 Tax=Burkholderia sp. BCC0405 TaxID=2676298 RepID=UPI00158C612B|nr:hypothetical protein [Burkholderia sp. BCC0405]